MAILGKGLAAQGIVARDGNGVDQGLQVVVMMRHGFVHRLLRIRACIVAQNGWICSRLKRHGRLNLGKPYR